MLQTVQVRYYAQLREALKTAKESIDFDVPVSEKQILDTLIAKHPKQRDLLASSRIAVNENYADANLLIESFTVIDVISPISGG